MKKFILCLIMVVLFLLNACSHLNVPTSTPIPEVLLVVVDDSEVDILIQELALDPAEIVIHAGTTVTWFNMDAARHMISANSGEFESPTLLFGDTYSFTFDTPGEYNYFNKYHADIKGRVIVVP